jgi:hypothetical protein
MAEFESRVLMLGVSAYDTEVSPLTELNPLYWDPKKLEKGYFIDVRWNEEGSIKSLYGLRGTPSDEQAGMFLDKIHAREPSGWYWAREPVNLIPFGTVVAMSHDFVDFLRESIGEDALSQFIVKPELHGREVYVCFSSYSIVYDYKKLWHDVLINSIDYLLSNYLSGEEADPRLKKRIDWLPFFYGTLSDCEQYLLRYLLYDSPNLDDETVAEKVSFMSEGNRAGYQLANLDDSLKREPGGRLIVPKEMMFASKDNAKKALTELVEKLTKN